MPLMIVCRFQVGFSYQTTRRRIDDDDVELAVAVDVDEQHGVADAEPRFDFLHLEGGDRGCFGEHFTFRLDPREAANDGGK